MTTATAATAFPKEEAFWDLSEEYAAWSRALDNCDADQDLDGFLEIQEWGADLGDRIEASPYTLEQVEASLD